MKRIIFHIDVNNAFLSWSAVEMLKNGSKLDIRTIPAVVSGDEKKRRGVVVAKSFPAKKAGIVSGEPLYMARRKVDKLYVVKSERQNYIKYSDAFYNILCKYTPVIERYSIDECFMDMTGMEMMFGDPVKLAYKIKDEIYDTLGFTVNVGVANSKVCAKMASDFEKPNKVHTLFDYEVKEKMWPLKVDDLFMVGKSSSKKLHELNINTVEDATDIMTLKKVVKKLSYMVGIRLREEEKYATVIAVQLKNNNFINFVHQKKLVNPVSSDEDIYEDACVLLKEMWNGDPIRLVGLRVSDFTDKSYEQVSLFERVGKSNERDKVQRAMDKINKKYGNNTIKSAALFDEDD
mgnify:CR=1 FL=1